MKFLIKKTAPSESDKTDEKNPMWLIAAVILCWGTSLNLLTKTIEPVKTYLPVKRSGRLLIDPYIHKNKLCLSESIKISLQEFDQLNAQDVIEELKKGDTIWYVPIESTGIFDQLFNRAPKVVAFGNKESTYLSIEAYNKSIEKQKRTKKGMIVITFFIPFLLLIIKYGFIDRVKREVGLHFYKYD